MRHVKMRDAIVIMFRTDEVHDCQLCLYSFLPCVLIAFKDFLQTECSSKSTDFKESEYVVIFVTTDVQFLSE